jgi:putative DNA methylase
MAKTTTKAQPWKDEGLNKAEWVAREVAEAVNAGKAWDLETVDFSDPNRPPTCLEVDFPMVPINEIATLEGKGSGALKPIYQISKWWARRRSTVFRAILLAAAIKAPNDSAEAAKIVWQVYYGNHQKKGTFKHLKVADIFMGGGTTVVEGSRLGMQMYGNDLNPVAWFVVKNELAQVDKEEVKALLAEIEAEVKPQIMPFYACDCPRGHKGKWTQISTGKVMGNKFDPLTLTLDERRDYSYEGPEVIYTFWAKHGPCQVTGCGHRTPVMTSPVVAVKTVSVNAWSRKCKQCKEEYDIEDGDARMAPSVPLVLAETERAFAVANLNDMGNPESAVCPKCGYEERFGVLGKPTKKKIDLSLIVHPDWLAGESSHNEKGERYGGSIDDSIDATVRWIDVRAKTCRLFEYRGRLPAEILPNTHLPHGMKCDTGTALGQGLFRCGACGTEQSLTNSTARTKRTAPVASYAFQGFCPTCEANCDVMSGRFFAPATDPKLYCASIKEWNLRNGSDLANYWPRETIPFGVETHPRLPDNGYDHWFKFFNERQLLVHSQLLQTILIIGGARHRWDVREYVLSAFQQFLRNQNMFCFWNIQRALEPHFSNNNYYPKFNPIENSVFSGLGRGDWNACVRFLLESLDWRAQPWEIAGHRYLTEKSPSLAEHITGNSVKVETEDSVHSSSVHLSCGSATSLSQLQDDSFDAVITDPPFGGLMQYSELSDFFHVWLRLALGSRYPDYYQAEDTPKATEAVSNRARHGTDSDEFYTRVLTASWREAHRILKSGGLLVFTFHHSADEPWVSVLESLFDAGFYLEATYPIRSDETKGTGQFGSKLIEYDIIHVCRKRLDEPKPISWPKLRRQVLQDVRELKELLEHHQEEGLPEADLQVIRRGKALEYFSRHYGKVYKDQETPMSVLEALLGINQLLDEEAGGVQEPPPHNAEPFTRMLLRLFDGKSELARDQIQKFLRGTGSSPSDFIDRGWVTELKKVFYLVPPLEIAQSWIGKQRKGLTSDYDQAMFFIGSSFENSGINASETLNNPNFLPHPALGDLLSWFKSHGADSATRNAASTAASLYRSWGAKNEPKLAQLSLFDFLGESE